jgi:hypothetical protein
MAIVAASGSRSSSNVNTTCAGAVVRVSPSLGVVETRPAWAKAGPAASPVITVRMTAITGARHVDRVTVRFTIVVTP